ncbi:type IV pilus biogenesis/stability protein PilW [Neptunomonas antarctica]|uniref:Type IV pilus assembly protein PilF n=1 Tax=Neptunomonas antarctica TaxID=619304 RepID=A0A1N7P7A2_9GAMM|nr:type IV pilus biogenesis/stability protein PilW [Neptunomonas antarctica]SIT06464.1 type IV pilus assembly protein PilF [Neptunomonas antarctica]
MIIARVLIGGLIGLLLSGCTGLQTESEAVNKNTVSTEGALQAYTTLGLQYLQSGDTANAKSAVQKALDIDTDYAPSYNALALIFQVEDEVVLAEKYYKKAIDLAPDLAMFHNNYGAFLFTQERYQEACVELAKATEDPFYNNRAQTFENLGRCYEQIGRSDVAIHAFERSLKTGGMRPLALVELADLYLSLGNIPKAEEYFTQFTELANSKQVNHSAKSLWVGIRLARENNKVSLAITYTLLLKNLYPESDEYKQYKESAR